MSGKRYTDEFKIYVVKQLTEQGHKASVIALQPGISPHSIYTWVNKHGQIVSTIKSSQFSNQQ